MPQTDRFRALYVLKYLWEHTDEEYPVRLAQIQIQRKRCGSAMVLSIRADAKVWSK